MNTLILMRHAKSDWSNPKQRDIDRPLNPRGKKAALLMGKWLKDNNHVPNFVICSTAVRTRETLGRIRLCTEIGAKDIKYDASLYEASQQTLFDIVKDAPWHKGSIMVLGHNPGIEDLLTYLCDSDFQLSKSGKLMPTASIAIIELPKKVESGKGKLVQLIRPKEL